MTCVGRGKLGGLVKHLNCVLQGLILIRIRHDADYYNVSGVLLIESLFWSNHILLLRTIDLSFS